MPGTGDSQPSQEDVISLLRQQMEEDRRILLDLVRSLQQAGQSGAAAQPANIPAATPSFTPFDSSSELWPDYWARFCTFAGANSIPEGRRAQVFLTNQSPAIYKLLSNLAEQQSPSKEINDLTMDEITAFMKEQFDPKRFIVRERYRFWSDMRRKPGETIQELAARIRQDAATCDFSSIRDPLDEALLTRFICSVNNEAVLKALFKVKAEELKFTRAVEVALETEEASRVAKETVYGNRSRPVNRVEQGARRSSAAPTGSKAASAPNAGPLPGTCYRCGAKSHRANECRFKDATCRHCQKVGHIESACRSKARGSSAVTAKKPVKHINGHMHVHAMSGSDDDLPKLEVPIQINGRQHTVEIDTATNGNFITEAFWKQLGRPELRSSDCRYESASQHDMPVLGTFTGKTTLLGSAEEHSIRYIVTQVPGLNLLGRTATKQLGISVDELLGNAGISKEVNAVFDHLEPDSALQEACQKLCDEFPDLWKDELGCLKDFELELKFKPDARPVFRKARPVPFAIREELEKAYDEGIRKGIWEPTDFNDYGTPVVPVRKPSTGSGKPKLRVCGDAFLHSQSTAGGQPASTASSRRAAAKAWRQLLLLQN